MASYADFTYYTATYLGTAIVSADFARLALRASATIDNLTFDRAAPIVTAATDTATINKIKMATCALAEESQKEDLVDGVDGIQSESIGSNSVSYAENSGKRLTNEMKQSKAAKLYLSSTGLMFRGFASGEYSGDIDAD
ncbi:MAG: hypothetical protein JZU60_02115 [Ilumatobacteraceae bacterium]|jgi:hypothetical protein|nr:hypothetical protein [Ilumatobacteraceae bacterium]